jgi:hypothetical protein
VSALRASRIHRTADHWLTPAAIASRLCEPVRTNAKHKPRRNESPSPGRRAEQPSRLSTHHGDQS